MTLTWRRDPAWAVADRPVDGDHGGRLYATRLGTGEIHVLEGAAAVVCRAALDGHDIPGIRDAAAAELQVDVSRIDVEVISELLDELLGLGLLAVRPSPVGG